MTLKEFLVSSLLNHNCEADVEVLSDYIIALIDSKTEVSEYQENLKAFLYDSTQFFVKDLIEYLKTNENEIVQLNDTEISESNISVINEKSSSIDQRILNSSDEEIKVDYEDSSLEAVSTAIPIVPLRQLREYSPERRNDSFESEKKPCSTFSKFGNCRYGDNCRFSHSNPPSKTLQRRRPVASCVKLFNLPYSALNPASLTEIMSEFGSVTKVTVFPEKGEASVQYANGEEASKAIKGIKIESFGIENVVIELEMIRSQFQSQSQAQHQNSFNHLDTDKSIHSAGININKSSSSSTEHSNAKIKLKLKLQSLITLQKQQQTLLETNLVSQQSLLTHLRNTSILGEEREELMMALNRIQESLMGIQEMLKRTTELVMETASTMKIEEGGVNGHVSSDNAKVGHFDSKKTAYNAYNSSKSLPFNNRKAHAHFQYQSNKSANLQYNNYSYSPKPNFNAPPALRQYTQTSHTLDLRPVTLKLGPLIETQLNDIHALQRHFSYYGPIQSLVISPEAGGVAVVKYQRHGDALRALENAGKDLGNSVELSFIK